MARAAALPVRDEPPGAFRTSGVCPSGSRNIRTPGSLAKFPHPVMTPVSLMPAPPASARMAAAGPKAGSLSRMLTQVVGRPPLVTPVIAPDAFIPSAMFAVPTGRAYVIPSCWVQPEIRDGVGAAYQPTYRLP